MRLAITYIFPATAGDQHVQYALRFVKSYNENPPAVDHQTIVVLNSARVTPEIQCMFASLRNVTFLERDGAAMDIGGYQEAAQKFPCDLMAFFGGSTYFKGAGWLLRMWQAYIKHGPALYGVMGNRGDSNVRVWPHVRTTGFWTTPDLINRHPIRVTRNDQRYEFEHGKTGLTSWFKNNGMKVFVVTWDAEYEWKDWDNIPNGFHRGNQSALLCGDRISEPPYYPVA